MVDGCIGEKLVTTEYLTAHELLKSKDTDFADADVTITFVMLLFLSFSP